MLQPTTRNQFIIAFTFFALAVFFYYVYYIRYWKWQDCIGEVLETCPSGSPANINTIEAIWAVVSVGFFLIALDRALKALRSRNKN